MPGISGEKGPAMDRKRKQEEKMKKKAVQKMLTMLIVSTMIVGSVPVSAQTVSENEGAAIEVTEVTPEETTDAPESEAKLLESEADNIGQAEETELPAEKEEVKKGTIDGFSYSVYEETDESGTIIRYAEITDYEEQDDITEITIPDQVTVDGEAVPVTSIGDRAFYCCTSLWAITIPESVTSIGDGAFNECTYLTAITIPEGVTSIGDGAFWQCRGLGAITISKSVTSIGDRAFGYCIRLTTITVAEGNTVYDSRNNCNAIIEKETNILIVGCQKTVIPEGVTSIGNGVFSGCSGLEAITIPESVTSIGDGVFSGCSGLTAITIPKGVTSIGDWAFEDCSGLTDITIPEGVTSIGDYAFYRCSRLKDIYYGGSEEEWHKIKIGQDAFTYYDEEDEENNINYTLHCNWSGSVPGASQAPAPSGQPTTTPTLSPSAQPTTTPAPVPSAQPTVTPSQTPGTQPTAAPSQTPSAQPTAASSQTPSAQQAEVPAPGTKLEASGRAFLVAEAGAGKKDSKPEVILTNLSKKDKKAKKVTIPKTVKIGDVEYQVTAIAPKALKNSKKLQSIVIPDTITEIGEGSFEGCTALKSITIGKNVTTIGKNAFKNCKNLKKITVKSTKLKKVGKSVLSGVHKKCVIKVPKKKLTAYKKLFKGKGQKKTVKITK